MSPPDADVNSTPTSRRWLRPRIYVLVSTILVVVTLAVFGRGLLAWETRQLALRQLRVGAVSAAEGWLAWSAWFDPSDGRTDVVRASCLRQRYAEALWHQAIADAEQHGAPAEIILLERQLGTIQTGTFNEELDELGTLLEAGASPDAVCSAFMLGYLARKDSARAEMVLDAWAKDDPTSLQLTYMRGVYWQWLADDTADLERQREYFNRAEGDYRKVLDQQPRHEPARNALADLLEDQDRLEEALVEYAALTTQAPERESACLGLARVLRGIGALDQAEATLESIRPRLEESPEAAAEMAYVIFEAGNHEQAQEWFTLADPETTADADILRVAATARAVGGDTTGAERLLARLDRENALWARKSELVTRLTTGPHDPKAADELRRLSVENEGLPVTSPADNGRPASELFIQKCSGCHGASGDGKGRGARHLFPPARSFRTENFRLVSTTNAVPTLEDVASVIQRGMPGSSMRAYDELTGDERSQLAREVLQIYSEGIRDKAVREFLSQGEEVDEEEVDEIVASCATPGDLIPVPPIGAATSQTIESGKRTYFDLGCNTCHGDDGTGTFDTPIYDELGRPAIPRDLACDPFKGGPEAESIYLRIVAGMPGTPHPSALNIPDDQRIALVHFCLSLSRQPKREQTNHQRAVEASRHRALWAFTAPVGRLSKSN